MLGHRFLSEAPSSRDVHALKIGGVQFAMVAPRTSLGLSLLTMAIGWLLILIVIGSLIDNDS